MNGHLEELRRRMEGGSRPRIWVIGDVMLDRYLVGTVERVSPEAPAPVLLLQETHHRLGGAANVAQNIRTLRGEAALGGAIGADEAGDRLREILSAEGIQMGGLLRRPGRLTTIKTRALAGAQQLLRIDHEQRAPLSAGELSVLLEGLAQDVPSPDLIVISDYMKGVVSSELVTRLRQLCPDTPIFVDPKGREYGRYVGASLITPNEREAALASGVEICDDASLAAAALRLATLVPGADILITRGARGMTLFHRDGRMTHAPARARRVYDVTGAGDTALAALALARAYELGWPDALHLANLAAGIAVSKIGAVAVHASELLSALAHEESGVKIVDRRGLAELRRTATLLGQKLVFTNGCFDLLHAGHLRLLQGARALGDKLIVAVNSDASVRRLKGESRPVVRQEDRVALLAGLEAVDYVTVFDEDTPVATLLECRPDVLVKGGDYSRETIVGAAEVESWGGRVATIPFVEGRSTTGTIQRLSRSR